MIIIAKADGSLSNVKPESVYQGSNLANEIIFIGEFAQFCMVTIAYTLPNGINVEESVLNHLDNVETENGIYNIWTGKIPGAVTQYGGNVTAQIFVYPGGEIGTAPKIATFSTSFSVNKGVPTENETVQINTVAELKTYIVNYNQDLFNQLNEAKLTEEQKNKLNAIQLEGSADKFLNEQGEYKEIQDLKQGDGIEIVDDKISINQEVKAKLDKADKIITDGKGNKFLNDAGTYTEACQCEDKQVLVDNALSLTSENPVQNKVVTEKLNDLEKNTLTQTDKDKLNAIKLDGEANKFLNEQGQYTEVNGGGGGSGIRTLETTPTTSTIGYVGEIVQVADGTAYQCTAITDGAYTWDLVLKKGNLGFGFSKDSSKDLWYLKFANDDVYFDTFENFRVNSDTIVNNRYFRYAVKRALTNPEWSTITDKTSNGRWTDEDRALARATLGITGGSGGLHEHHLTLNGALVGNAIAYSKKATAFTDIWDMLANATYVRNDNAPLVDDQVIKVYSIIGIYYYGSTMEGDFIVCDEHSSIERISLSAVTLESDTVE